MTQLAATGRILEAAAAKAGVYTDEYQAAMGRLGSFKANDAVLSLRLPWRGCVPDGAAVDPTCCLEALGREHPELLEPATAIETYLVTGVCRGQSVDALFEGLYNDGDAEE